MITISGDYEYCRVNSTRCSLSVPGFLISVLV